ncbi:MAG TPA: DUF5808 domain-containing protein [Cellulomonas sp.]|uniref:DUF5808 domain-containing protein n=1 Tax=Cellulomonas sp. TaxID=40001 RepID=UPI002E358FC0|nr:DUF5808 domain-containing protein [Cellulomonas sp.]HEX5331764.1 DUF5808 domain-containing protein [Cellulomonas sp.]
MTGNDVSAAIDQYFLRFRVAVLASGKRVDDDTVDDLRAHVVDRVGDAGSLADVTHVLAELGTPQALAAEVTAASPQDDGPARRHIASHGRLLGVPYDVRPPSSAREASRWWNPLDRRVLVPKSWGVGWTVNVGALAVRTGVVRPDDEDVPFGAVPPRTVAATLAAPVAVLAAVGTLAAVSWRRLPATVPTRWSLSGDVTAEGARASTVLGLVGLAAVPTAMAAAVHARRSPALDRVAASAESLLLATTALSVLAQTVHTARGRSGVWPLWVGRAASAALPFALLVGVSRVGRTAEQRLDLSTHSMNGPLA